MDNSPELPRLIPGGLAVDDRGQLLFANAFSFAKVARFYMVENFSTDVVRAFHGHRKEEKFVLPVSGSAILAAVCFRDPSNPDREAKVHRYVLSSRSPQILHIPAGFANGFRPLEPGTKLMFFSSSSLADSKDDDFRFAPDFWGKEVWNVEHR